MGFYRISKFLKKVVDFSKSIAYNITCVTVDATSNNKAGCGSAWLERLVWDQEVAGSNPVTPTVTGGCVVRTGHRLFRRSL